MPRCPPVGELWSPCSTSGTICGGWRSYSRGWIPPPGTYFYSRYRIPLVPQGFWGMCFLMDFSAGKSLNATTGQLAECQDSTVASRQSLHWGLYCSNIGCAHIPAQMVCYEALLVPKLLDTVKTIRRRCLTRNASGQCHSEGGLNHSEVGLYIVPKAIFTIRKTVYSGGLGAAKNVLSRPFLVT